MAIVIRQMSEDDVPTLVRIHSEVFKEYDGTMMGSGYLESLYDTLACDTVCISIVALEGSRILGWIGGVGDWPRFQKDLIRRNILRAPEIFFSILKNRPSLFAKTFSVLWRVLLGFVPLPRRRDLSGEETRPSREAALLVIGIVPPSQNRGLGQLMMEHFHQRLLSKGFTTSSLKTFSDNEAGNRAFQKAGYKLSGTYAGMNCYTKDLTVEGDD